MACLGPGKIRSNSCMTRQRVCLLTITSWTRVLFRDGALQVSNFRFVSVRAVYKGVNKLGARHSPPDIGGVDATSRRSRAASFDGADGVVRKGTCFKKRIPKHFGN